jgi:hypothetical protein
MTPETKTNISSLAATAGVTAFVVWMAFFATTERDSIFTHDARTSFPAVAAPATPSGAADAQPAADNAPVVGRG